MLPELGHYALILALWLAVIQVIFPLYGAHKNIAIFMQLSKFTAWAQCFFVAISFFILGCAFLTNDFSVLYVAENSNTHLPLLYRFCAIWGAHEGSLLLWVFILTLWMAAVAFFSRVLPLAMLARVLAVLAIVAIGFYLFLLLTSDPFVRLLVNTPTEGRDLNPLLQDPGLVSHPPMLYMGYVGFSVAFAFAIAALLNGRLDSEWARWARPWTLLAWSFLTLGIVLGSWWSYRELGWGGWWFWDPVENASFMPWLCGTALIHCLAVAEKRNLFKAWTVLLAVCTFSLSLLGTFLVRSGILISVHAFAADAARGQYLLKFLFFIVGGSLLVYAIRGKKLLSAHENVVFGSREMMLLMNNMVLFVAMLTVLLGTIYPLFVEALGGASISVGYPYFNMVFIPLMVPLFLLIGVGPLLHWRGMSPGPLAKKLFFIFIFSIILAVILPLIFRVPLNFEVILGLTLVIWMLLTLSTHFYLRSKSLSIIAMTVAHLGLAITVLGIVLSQNYSTELNLKMQVGDQAHLGSYQFQFTHLDSFDGPNYHALRADMNILENNHFYITLHPELRLYAADNTELSKVDINVGIFRDLYVALGEPIGKNAWAVRIYEKPFVRWIWWGGLLMLLGGVLALLDKIKRATS